MAACFFICGYDVTFCFCMYPIALFNHILVKNRSIYLFLTFVLALAAHAGDKTFQNFTSEIGLISNYVDEVVEDKRGMIWVASHKGLCRFDGSKFESFTIPDTLALNPNRNYIKTIFVLDSSNLLLGTLNNHFVFNTKTKRFTIFEAGEHSEIKQIVNRSEQIIDEGKGDLLIPTNWGLYRYDKQNDLLSRFYSEESGGNLLSDNVYALCHDTLSTYWVGTNKGGLDLLDVETGVAEHFNTTDKGVPGDIVRSIIKDKDGNLWVASVFVGIFLKKAGSDTFVKIPLYDEESGAEKFPLYSSLCEDSDGNIWIGTHDSGVYIYKPSSGQFEHYHEERKQPNNLPVNSVDHIFKDRYGNMWLATHGAGVCMYSPYTSSITHVKKSYQNGGLPGKFVSGFSEDGKGNIWITTDGNGLCRLSPDGVYKTFTKADGLASDASLDVIQLDDRYLAVASWNGGLSLLDKNTFDITNYAFNKHEITNRRNHIVSVFHYKQEGQIWCATFESGIQIFDIDNRRFLSQEELNEVFPFWNVPRIANKVLIDKHRYVWILDNDSLYYVNDTIHNFSRIENCNPPLFNPVDILEDSEKQIWLLNNNNLYLFQHELDSLECKLTIAESFRSILQDSAGMLWLTTDNGVISYNPLTGQSIHHAKLWGGLELCYFYRSAFTGKTGKVYFGSLDGYVICEPKSSPQRLIEPNVEITGIYIYGGRNSVPKAVELLDEEIVLNYDESFLFISFAALNYIDNSKSEYKYMLDGFDKDWVTAGIERKASYTNVSPGSYLFRLKTTDSFGRWQEKEATVRITVLPPWWQTLWFKIFLVVLLIALVLAGVLHREKSIKLKNKQLERLVTIRTKELADANDQLVQANVEMESQKAAVENRNKDLKEKKLVIEMKNSQLQEALNVKDRLISVIAHDLKNPLTTLQGFANMLSVEIASGGSEIQKQYTDNIKNSANKMLTLTVSLLEWARFQTGSLVFKPIDMNAEIVLTDSISLMYETALEKGIAIETDYSCRSSAFIDPRMISTVLRNLLSNAVKFTPAGGKIMVNLFDDSEHVVISIADTGVGMDSVQLQALLDDNEQLESSEGTVFEKGSGIGLQICRSFVAKNNGEISVKSSKGKGTVFTVLLPKGKQKLTAQAPGFDVDTDGALFEFPDNSSQKEKPSMLVIDDNKELTSMIGELFKKDFEVSKAYDGKQGLDLAQETVPDIILTDISMPQLNGKQLCSILKNNTLTCHIPVVMITAQHRAEDQIQAYKFLADSFIAKPFNPNVLRHEVHSLITNRRLLSKYVQASMLESKNTKVPDNIDDKIISKAIEIIDKQYSDPNFGVSELTGQLSISRTQLYRKFKAMLSNVPVDYIRSVRLHRAAELMRVGSYRVSEIAYLVGFSDPKYFTTCFRKEYGMTPREYSSKHK